LFADPAVVRSGALALAVLIFYVRIIRGIRDDKIDARAAHGRF
jgi:hypothetical protein